MKFSVYSKGHHHFFAKKLKYTTSEENSLFGLLRENFWINFRGWSNKEFPTFSFSSHRPIVIKIQSSDPRK